MIKTHSCAVHKFIKIIIPCSIFQVEDPAPASTPSTSDGSRGVSRGPSMSPPAVSEDLGGDDSEDYTSDIELVPSALQSRPKRRPKKTPKEAPPQQRSTLEQVKKIFFVICICLNILKSSKSRLHIKCLYWSPLERGNL